TKRPRTSMCMVGEPAGGSEYRSTVVAHLCVLKDSPRPFVCTDGQATGRLCVLTDRPRASPCTDGQALGVRMYCRSGHGTSQCTAGSTTGEWKCDGSGNVVY